MTNKVQVSYSEGRDGRIFVVGGDTYDEFFQNLTDAIGPQKALQVVEDFQVVANPAAAPAVAAAAPLRGAQTSQAGTAPATAAAPGAPTCAHGPRTFRSGQGKKGPWSAWFCPLPSDRKSEQCEAIWG